MRKYEVMFIVRPDVVDEDLDKLIANLETYVVNGGGTVAHVEKMGKRRLAYVVRKFQDGFYVLFQLDAPGTVIKEFERRLRVTEQVIKFITVRTDEEEQRLDKIKKHRDSRQKGRGTHAQAAAEAAQAQQPAEAQPGV
jgi:small subunit ribosomal protein S6